MVLKRKTKKARKPKRPYVGEYGVPIEGAWKKVGTAFGMLALSAVLGFIAGFVVWAAFGLVSTLTGFIWGIFADSESASASLSIFGFASSILDGASIPSWWLPFAICSFGGLVIGLWTKCVGGQPDELPRIMETIKETGEYRTDGIGRSVVGFLLPLMFGGSIGPEAGLTGIIAASVCWIGRTLRAAGLRVKGAADVAASAVLAAIFATPLIGVVAVARSVTSIQKHRGKDSPSSGGDVVPDPLAYDFRFWVKILLYAVAAVGAIGGVACVGAILGPGGGLPRFDGATPRIEDLPWLVPCVALGYLGALLFHAGKTAFGKVSTALGDRAVLKPVLGGVVLGLAGTVLPYVLFPGESQTHDLMEGWRTMAAGTLIATGLVKCLATPWCLSMGWKGGHFFPCIFAGVACGYGIAAASGAEPVLCVCATTATLVAGIQRSPVMALALLLLCFPLENLLCMALACVIGAKLPVPKGLLGADE